jgi:hypothetical protein
MKDVMKSKPWSKILLFYKDLFSSPRWHHARGLVLLSEGILASPYAEHIYGCTSHKILYIAQTPTFLHFHQVLAITPDPKTDELIFEWKGSAWKRRYAPEDALAGFKKFLKQQKWFL